MLIDRDRSIRALSSYRSITGMIVCLGLLERRIFLIRVSHTSISGEDSMICCCNMYHIWCYIPSEKSLRCMAGVVRLSRPSHITRLKSLRWGTPCCLRIKAFIWGCSGWAKGPMTLGFYPILVESSGQRREERQVKE